MKRLVVSSWVWLLLMVWATSGVLCQNSFEKPVTDPCCENIRVHYRQKTVYEILNLDHDDLQRGINCFQRVCPSQFPAFYRVMYIGGLRGTSVSFAVCTDGANVDSDNSGTLRSSNKIERKRRKRNGIITNNEEEESQEGTIFYEKLHTFPEYSFKTYNHNKTINQKNINAKYAKLFLKFVDASSERWQRKRRKRRKRRYQSPHESFSKTKREADTSRTIFEIPEPRPSVVYTLTGVCFCLRVESNSLGDSGHIQPLLAHSEITDRVVAMETKMLNERQINATSANSNYHRKVNDFSNGNKHPRENSDSAGNVVDGCKDGNCKLQGNIKRRRRNTFMDSFMTAVLKAQEKARNQSQISTTKPPPSYKTEERTTQGQPKAHNEDHRDSSINYNVRYTKDPKTENIIMNTMKVGTIKDGQHPLHIGDRGGGGIGDGSDGGSVGNSGIRDGTGSYGGDSRDGNGDSDGRSGFDERVKSSPDAHLHDRMLEETTRGIDNDDTDDDLSASDFKNRLVVFASFSHDVHFIGSISMTVSVASSCRSNVPLNQGFPDPINNTRPTTGNLDSGTRTTTVHTMTNTSTMISGLPAMSSEAPKQETSPYRPHQDNTRTNSMVEEVREKNDGSNSDDGDGDNDFDDMLIWQVATGAAFAVLLFLIIVLFGIYCRQRKRKHKERYASLNPDSTLQRSQPEPFTTNTAFEPVTNSTSPNTGSSTTINTTAMSTVSDPRNPISIPRSIQAMSRNDPTNIINVDTVYPMHIRLRSLSAAAEAARLRGQEALRMLNNDTQDAAAQEISVTGTSNQPSVPENAAALYKTVNVNSDTSTGIDNGYSRANPARLSPKSDNRLIKPLNALNPALLVSEGSTVREFDLGQFAVYRNDIMLKLRRCGLRAGRRKRKVGTSSGDYDNDYNDGTESVYSCYAGGETDI